MVVLRRITLRLREDSVAVIECGYMKSARAEPSAKVAYAHWALGPLVSSPRGLPGTGPGWDSALPAEWKIASKPPSLIGM